MRFLVDECTGPAVARWLREQQPYSVAHTVKSSLPFSCKERGSTAPFYEGDRAQRGGFLSGTANPMWFDTVIASASTPPRYAAQKQNAPHHCPWIPSFRWNDADIMPVCAFTSQTCVDC